MLDIGEDGSRSDNLVDPPETHANIDITHLRMNSTMRQYGKMSGASLLINVEMNEKDLVMDNNNTNELFPSDENTPKGNDLLVGVTMQDILDTLLNISKYLLHSSERYSIVVARK